MNVTVLCKISCSARIAPVGHPEDKVWINAAWLDGEKVKPRFTGLVYSKIASRDFFNQPRNQAFCFLPGR